MTLDATSGLTVSYGGQTCAIPVGQVTALEQRLATYRVFAGTAPTPPGVDMGVALPATNAPTWMAKRTGVADPPGWTGAAGAHCYTAANPFTKKIADYSPPLVADTNGNYGGTKLLGLHGSWSTSRDWVVAQQEFAMSVHIADAATQRVVVTMKNQVVWDNAHRYFHNVPMAPGWVPEGGEAHMTIIDPINNCAFDFFDIGWTGTNWLAGYGNSTSLAGTGIYTHGGQPSQGGSSCNAQGILWPHEWQVAANNVAGGYAGINHALNFVMPYDDANPTTLDEPGSDTEIFYDDNATTQTDFEAKRVWDVVGATLRPPIWYGQIIQLDPSFAIPSNWPPSEKAIARCLQIYGMIPHDKSDHQGSFRTPGKEMYTVSDPYAWMSSEPYYDPDYIPLVNLKPLLRTRFRVLQPAGVLRTQAYGNSNAALDTPAGGYFAAT